jgi:hypothetical protein
MSLSPLPERLRLYGEFDLPLLVCFHMFSFLEVRDIVICGMVSKSWYAFCSNDGLFWRILYTERRLRRRVNCTRNSFIQREWFSFYFLLTAQDKYRIPYKPDTACNWKDMCLVWFRCNTLHFALNNAMFFVSFVSFLASFSLSQQSHPIQRCTCTLSIEHSQRGFL